MDDKHKMLDEWQRVHPIALVYFAAQLIKGAASNFYVFIPIAIALKNSFTDDPMRVVLLTGAVLCIAIFFVIASYFAFQFRVLDKHIEIHKGLFKRVRLNLPFDKIQDVRLSQPIYYRFNDMRVVTLDTAGSAKDEAVIVALPVVQAENIAQRLSQLQSTIQTETSSSNSSAATTSADEQLLITRSVKDLVLHGITNNRVWIILGVFSPFIDDAIRAADERISALQLTHYFSVSEQGLGFVVGAIAVTVLLTLTLVTLLSVAGAILNFYDYKLLFNGQRLKRQSGLLTKHQVSVNKIRIQHIEYNQDWLDNLFGRINLVFKQLKHTLSVPGEDKQTLVVPSVTAEQAAALGQYAFSHVSPHDLTFHPISKRFITKYSLTLNLLLCIIIGIALWLIPNNPYYVFFLALPVVVEGLIILRWYRWGYTVDDNNIYVRQGLFATDVCVSPLYKTQLTQLSETYFQRKAGFANAILILASKKITVPMIGKSEALKLINVSLAATQNQSKRWM
ncbi:PH domain-containing protein [Alteromonas facilis]|uniref:PH domain-containing protein n=1 Tax=Alteromonas facilis TaxID=2048004 RepID=UPI000C28E1B2|nr:PH domain-containing protein [Alteromonas facilis]